MGWEFLTSHLKLDTDNLWVSIYREDDEALSIWHKVIGLSENRIIKLGAEDNFWSMGETGPCGPCSEIIIDQSARCASAGRRSATALRSASR